MNNKLESRKMRSWTVGGLLLALGLATPGLTWAQNLIRSISSNQQASGEVIRVELSEGLASPPTGFSIQAPPRVAIDLPNVGNGLGKSAVEINSGNVRAVNVASSGDRTRLVLSLRQPASYRTELQGKTLLILLDSANGVASAGPANAAQPVQFASSQNTDQQPLRDIDFRRGPDGSGRVIVGLASTQIGVDLKQQGQNLVVEFLRSTLPESCAAAWTSPTSARRCRASATFQSGDKVRMVVEPRGAWEHSAYQTDNQFVLEVRPLKLDPNKLTQGPRLCQGEKLSLEFPEHRGAGAAAGDRRLHQLQRGDQRHRDRQRHPAPEGCALGPGAGHHHAEQGPGRAQDPATCCGSRRRTNSPPRSRSILSRRRRSPTWSRRTQSFQLNYTKAEDIARALLGQLAGASGNSGGGGATGSSSSNNVRILSPRGTVLAEGRTNQLFVSDIPSKLEEVSVMIAKIDIPVRQVLIEARIVEADDRFGRALGIKLGSSDLRGLRGGTPGYSVGSGNYLNIGGNYSNVGVQTLQTPNTATSYNDTQFVNLPAPTLGTGTPATFALSLFSATANRFLNLELSALEAEGKGKIVSSPRVVTADQVKAKIEQGEQIPYLVASSAGNTSIQFRDASLKLEVTPQITPEGNVILDVDVNKDSRGDNTPAGPAINTKHVKTQVLVENGGTVVIGGIFSQTDRDEVNKVPLLGDIPYLGNLFKNTSKLSNRTELLIFITPKVVTDRSSAR
jgi:type IV pilus assembly protein PilQ